MSKTTNYQTDLKVQLFGFLLFLIFFSLIGTAISFWYAKSNGIDLTALNDYLSQENSYNARHFFRVTAITHHLSFFIIPSIFFGIFFYKNKWLTFFKLNTTPDFKTLIFSFLLLICSLPIVQLSYWLNMQLPLPEWMQMAEDNTAGMIGNLLAVDSLWELLGNLLVIAIIPAIGEELFFRGIIQQKLVERLKNPHIAIWLGAMVFSAIHFQFEGFLPRMLLGALLGYVYYWTSNLWIPIILHLFNNGIQVIGAYAMPDMLPESAEIEASMGMFVWAGIGAIGVWFLVKKLGNIEY